MIPQERQLVDELFDRLAHLEASPRDPDAERAIADGLKRAPNAVYALVQTALVQDEALKRADARIRELTGEDDAPRTGGGFLDTMRSALTGHGSVPSVRPSVGGGSPDPRWNASGTYAAPPPAAPQQGGGSFLGTAAASAAGMIGGALLLNSIGSLFGHHGGSAFAATPTNTPWGNSAADSDPGRDAGLNDIGGSGNTEAQSAGLFDNGGDSDPGGDVGGDFGGDDSA